MLEIDSVSKRYGRDVVALHDVSLSVGRGDCVGLVGESGSGKTTLARCILMLEAVSDGRILFDGSDLARLTRREARDVRARVQMVFQDPYASLNPRLRVADIVAEPMEIHRKRFPLDRRARRDRVAELLQLVGLGPQHLHRYPHEFSGGQRQRIGIARALAANPDLLVLDEPTSALDVSVQAQILNLLRDLQARLGLTYLLISHDLAVVRYLCTRVAFLEHGRLVEQGATEQAFAAPQSDYARMLLASVPQLDPDRSSLRTTAASR